jgi:phosphoribosylformimino-5-aminoimidazole carboxamide ribotide isomerase
VLVLPAIDIRGGLCVRLRQGDYAQETVFGSDPAAMARHWAGYGARWIHLVDLDGAKAGRPVNGESIRRIVASGVAACQFGGGLRTDDDITEAFSWGLERVILGSAAVRSPAWFVEVCRRWPGRIVLGIDAKSGMAAVEGWLEVSAVSALDLARACSKAPLAAIVYTDIHRDGMMHGPNLEAMAEMAAAVAVPVIASGGVSSIADIDALRQRGLAGCIVGRALYEGKIDPREALGERDKPA